MEKGKCITYRAYKFHRQARCARTRGKERKKKKRRDRKEWKRMKSMTRKQRVRRHALATRREERENMTSGGTGCKRKEGWQLKAERTRKKKKTSRKRHEK